MLTYREALKIIADFASAKRSSLAFETLPLEKAFGRTLSSALYAREHNPPFDCSAMDGYLVRSEVLTQCSVENPVTLRVVGTIQAGEVAELTPQDTTSCFEIMTGATAPRELGDAIIRVEDTTPVTLTDGSSAIKCLRSVAPGENIRRTGEDIKEGSLLLPPGVEIGPEQVLALSMSGHSEVPVYQKLRALIISTGNELVPHDVKDLQPGRIRNSTAPLLLSLLTTYGVDTTLCGIIGDSESALTLSLQTALSKKPDLIITTGGVSMGRFDLVNQVLQSLGAEVVFHKCQIRPGKPILFTTVPTQNTAIFGLPGNPVSVAVTARFFVKPYIRALLGGEAEMPRRVPFISDNSQGIKTPAGLTFFQRGVWNARGVQAIAGQASFMVSSLTRAEGWLVGDADSGEIKHGELVDWYSLW